MNLAMQLGKILKSDSKRTIVHELYEGPKTFTQLLKGLGMTSGNLNNHLLWLSAYGKVSKSNGLYVLTEDGRDIVNRINRVL